MAPINIDNLYTQFRNKYTECWNDGHFTLNEISQNEHLISMAKNLVRNYKEICIEKYDSFKYSFNLHKFNNNNEPTSYYFENAPCGWSSFIVSIMMCEFH